MSETLNHILHALLANDVTALSHPGMMWGISIILFIAILLENGFLPLSFLPGDTLLILSGALISRGVLPFFPTFPLLVIASAMGYWLSYLQGKWLHSMPRVQGWLAHSPSRYHQRAHTLFSRYGLPALLFGRFLGFVRTLLPLLAGMSTLSHSRFQLYNWLGALVWVYIMTKLGGMITAISKLPHHSNLVMEILIILPGVFLVAGVATAALLVWRKRRQINK
ncbi:DedA family protein [Pectobacteriaceae bacterium CE90]|nr:DedA family protein [Pectobacteriaceae bacterium CE90]